MKTINILLFVTALVWSAFSCNEEQEKHSALNNLEINYVVLDTNDIVRSTFNSEEDVVFALEIINHFSSDIFWKDGICGLMQKDDFYMIYKRHATNNNVQLIPIGKPYITPVYCLMINLPPIKILANSNFYAAKIPWLNNPENGHLTPGDYYSNMKFTFTSVDGVKNFNLEVRFTVI